MEKLLEPLRDGAGQRDVLRVLSDALLEKADPWGEAIQLALDLEARFPGEDEAIDGERRLRRLIARHGASWNTRLNGARTDPWDSWVQWYRAMPAWVDAHDRDIKKRLDGPIGSLSMPVGSEFMRHAAVERVTQLFINPHAQSTKLDLSRAKSVTSLSVPWLGQVTLDALEKAPCLPKLESLHLVSGQAVAISRPELERLLAFNLPKLDRLAFERLEFGVPGAEALRDGLKWKLQRLNLEAAGLGVKGSVALFAAKWFPSLRQLSLADNTMGPAGAEALAAVPFKQLTALDLSHTASAAKSLVPFIEKAKWPSLRALRLVGAGFKGKAASALAKLQFSELRQLALSHQLMGDEGLGEFSKSKSLKKVRVLLLDNNAIKGPGLAALGASPVLKTVEELELSHNKFQNTGAKGLGASKNLGSLRVLTLGHNWLGVQGLKLILGNASLKKFEELREGMNNYAAALPKTFASSKTLSLVSLRLGPETTTDALEELLASPRVATLEWIDFSCVAFDDVQAEALLAGPLAKAKTVVKVNRRWCSQLTDAGAEKLKPLGARLDFI
ncbi:MAG: hypothetical protein QM817_40485 [Archangium sp.]